MGIFLSGTCVVAGEFSDCSVVVMVLIIVFQAPKLRVQQDFGDRRRYSMIFFFFFFESIMVRLRYRTICSTLSIVTILLRSSSHLTFAMKKAIPLNPIESALRIR
jgi:hypothetical protein